MFWLFGITWETLRPTSLELFCDPQKFLATLQLAILVVGGWWLVGGSWWVVVVALVGYAIYPNLNYGSEEGPTL